MIGPRERIREVKRGLNGLSASSTRAAPEQELPTEGNERQAARSAEDVRRESTGGSKNSGEIRVFRDRGGETAAEIEQRLEVIAAKVEEAIAEAGDKGRYDVLSERIENVRQELTVRIAEAWLTPDTKPLEELLLNLSEKLDKLQKPQGEEHAIEALEQQVSELTAQFDRSNASLSSVANIGETIGELLVEMERIPNVAFEAAENAVRSVLKDRAYNSEISQQLEGLRSFHDEADRRTLSTLTTVHDVLKKLVDRLAVVEEALSNRPRASEPFASGAPPGFTHPQHDRERSAQPEMEDAKNHGTDAQGVAAGRADPDATPDEPENHFIGLRRGFPGLRERLPPQAQASRQSMPQEPEIAPLHSDLVAAARRAGRLKPHFISGHKGPLLYALIAILAALGTYSVIEITSKGQPTNVSQSAGNVIATDAAPQEASAPQASASAPLAASSAVQSLASASPPSASAPIASSSVQQPTATAPLPPAPTPQATASAPQASASAPQATASAQPASAPVQITSVVPTPPPTEWSAEPTAELAPNAIDLTERSRVRDPEDCSDRPAR